MERLLKVRSTAPSVEPLETDANHVYINNGITEIHEEGTEEGGGFDGFEIAEMLVYSKDEYIALISQEKDELSETVNSILTDIIPSIVG